MKTGAKVVIGVFVVAGLGGLFWWLSRPKTAKIIVNSNITAGEVNLNYVYNGQSQYQTLGSVPLSVEFTPIPGASNYSIQLYNVLTGKLSPATPVNPVVGRTINITIDM